MHQILRVLNRFVVVAAAGTLLAGLGASASAITALSVMAAHAEKENRYDDCESGNHNLHNTSNCVERDKCDKTIY